jgi:hypothetical protein
MAGSLFPASRFRGDCEVYIHIDRDGFDPKMAEAIGAVTSRSRGILLGRTTLPGLPTESITPPGHAVVPSQRRPGRRRAELYSQAVVLELDLSLTAGQVLEECSGRGLVVRSERELAGLVGSRHWHLGEPGRAGTLELNEWQSRVWVKVHPLLGGRLAARDGKATLPRGAELGRVQDHRQVGRRIGTEVRER